MQRRERMLFLATGLLVGGWLVDSVLVGPGLAWLGKVRAESEAAAKTAQEAQALEERKARIMGDWRTRHAAGLLDDEDGVRFRVQQALVASARASSCTIDSVSGSQRVPATPGHAYDLLRMTVTGQGSLAEVQAFLAGIESAAVALRIERCEIAARDARKDQLDLSLTLSTRIVATSARAGRVVPPGTAAWHPDARDGKLDAATLAARPFQSDRRSTPKEKHREVEKTVVATAPTAGGWALVGVVVGTEGAEAFLRHLGDGKERLVRVGDEVADGKAVAIDESSLRFTSGGQERQVAVGYDLTGVPIPAAAQAALRSPSVTATGSTARGAPNPAAPSPFQVPTTTVNPDTDSILQRLRQQRNRASGAAP